MTALTIRLPASVHKEIKALAEAEGVSINQFLTLAAVEKIKCFTHCGIFACGGK